MTRQDASYVLTGRRCTYSTGAGVKDRKCYRAAATSLGASYLCKDVRKETDLQEEVSSFE